MTDPFYQAVVTRQTRYLGESPLFGHWLVDVWSQQLTLPAQPGLPAACGENITQPKRGQAPSSHLAVLA